MPLPYKMNNSLNWFESPLPKPAQQRALKNDPWPAPLDLPSPSPLASLRPHTLSPWSCSLADPPAAALALPPLPARPADRLLFSEDDEEELVTPVRGESDVKEERSDGEVHTTGRKSEGELLQSARRPRPREKGLRKLSQRAFEIVQEEKNVTYKEVAAYLVRELNENDFDPENKEEQNIKRRVYDALNVLIALGVLRKDGRKIVSNKAHRDRMPENTHRSPEHTHTAPKLLETLRQKVALREEALEEKRAKLRAEQAKLEKITILMARNMQKDRESHEKRVYFPFIGVTCRTALVEGREGALEVEDDRFEMRVAQTLQPFGDMDTLRYFTAKATETSAPAEQVGVKLESEAGEANSDGEEMLQFCSWR